MTIDRVTTLSRSQAAEILLDDILPPRDMMSGEPAWIGFETPDSGMWSPLRSVDYKRFRSLIIPMADVEHADDKGPSPYIASVIVSFCHELMDAATHYSLFVHCRAGMYRSGAVAQWLREDYGIPESPSSNRLHLLGDSRNRLLLKLLRSVDDRRHA